MDSNTVEALKAKAMAEKHFALKDFVGAINYCLKAQRLCPGLEGVSQMLATFQVHSAAEVKINGELDFYSILGSDASANKPKLKKQYKKLAVLLHPDKNKTVGAEGAFKLISEAWTLLSDRVKRIAYDKWRSSFAGFSSNGGGYSGSKFSTSSRGGLDSFWTMCTSCHVQYEYLRKYVNKRLSCKNCRCIFIAVETGLAHVDGSLPYCTYSNGPEQGFQNHNYGVSYTRTMTGYCSPSSGNLGHRTGYGSEYVSNISFQGNSSGNSMEILDSSGLSKSSFLFCQSNLEAKKTKAHQKHQMVDPTGNVDSNGCTVLHEVLKPKRGRPNKKRKIDLGTTFANGPKETSPRIALEAKIAYGNECLKPTSKLPFPSETSNRRSLTFPAYDVRQFLMDKARSEIRLKLDETRIAIEAEKRNIHNGAGKSTEIVKSSDSYVTGYRPELKRSVSMPITVPDSDFHDFDQDRSEECFEPKQIWALYDEEDGMPRLYCLIRQVLSIKPFKSYISYLSSKTDSEFGCVNWLDSGFTKSCGSFRVFSSEMVEQVNIFSHLLSREKTGRGGCVRIYPRSGDIWAVYRNWSPEWDRTTPDEVRHQYEMVEVLDDYTEDHGVWVTPLIKLDRFKTVYQRSPDNNAFRFIPKREMLRFSHQVPSCPLQVDGTNLPEGCWELDPAAIPDELLRRETDDELQNKESPTGATEKATETSYEQYSVKSEGVDEDGNLVSSPEKELPCASKACMEGMVSNDLSCGRERIPVDCVKAKFHFSYQTEINRE